MWNCILSIGNYKKYPPTLESTDSVLHPTTGSCTSCGISWDVNSLVKAASKSITSMGEFTFIFNKCLHPRSSLLHPCCTRDRSLCGYEFVNRLTRWVIPGEWQVPFSLPKKVHRLSDSKNMSQLTGIMDTPQQHTPRATPPWDQGQPGCRLVLWNLLPDSHSAFRAWTILRAPAVLLPSICVAMM